MTKYLSSFARPTPTRRSLRGTSSTFSHRSFSLGLIGPGKRRTKAFSDRRHSMCSPWWQWWWSGPACHRKKTTARSPTRSARGETQEQTDQPCAVTIETCSDVELQPPHTARCLCLFEAAVELSLPQNLPPKITSPQRPAPKVPFRHYRCSHRSDFSKTCAFPGARFLPTGKHVPAGFTLYRRRSPKLSNLHTYTSPQSMCGREHV